MRILSSLAVMGPVMGSAIGLAAASPACAQVWLGQTWDNDAPTTTPLRLDNPAAFDVAPAGSADFAPSLSFNSDFVAPSTALTATTRNDIWREGDGFSDRLRISTRGILRRADGAPLPPTAFDRAALEVEDYDVRYTRSFLSATGHTPSGLEVSLTPHAGFGVGSEGGSAEAGATLKIGSGLNRLAPEGHRAFGERPRWYLYAASSGRAVGYNFARTRDGDFTRSGMTHDSGNFLGNASVGVAFRRGDMQSSIGIVYREIKAQGLRGGDGFDREVSESLLAFQFSIKPER